MDEVWIMLGENTPIETVNPIWNIVIDDLGNRGPGSDTRRNTVRVGMPDILAASLP